MPDLLLQLEINITLFFQNLGAWLTFPMKFFTFLGTEEFYILVMPALYWCIDSAAGIRTGIMLAISGGLNTYLKFLFHSPRPYWVDPRVKAFSSETSFGLPSGHSQNAASIWGALAASFKKTWLTVLLVIVIIMIGLSRIYLGVHFTRDVITGWLVGGILVLLMLKLEKPILHWIMPKALSYQIIAALLFSALMVLLGYITLLPALSFSLPQAWIDQAVASGGTAPDPLSLDGIYTVAGVLFGFAAGLFWMIKKFGFTRVKGSIVNRVLRYLLGLGGIGVLYIALKMVFPESPQWLGFGLRFIRYALIGLWVSAGAPLIFKKLNLDK